MLYRPNTAVADRVLSFVEMELGDTDSIFLERFVNCREQGWAIVHYTKNRKVAFSECRNSDETVVYWGTAGDFAFNTNIPNEEVYATKKFFSWGKDLEAAQFIAAYLND